MKANIAQYDYEYSGTGQYNQIILHDVYIIEGRPDSEA